jgi:VanZ family protein
MALLQRQRLWRWLPMLLWMAVIFAVSHTPTENIPAFGAWDVMIKKGSHFMAYAILALLVYMAFPHKGWAWLIATLYAVSDEYHQTFVPGRSGLVSDVIIDSLGALAALLVLHYFVAPDPELEYKPTKPCSGSWDKPG